MSDGARRIDVTGNSTTGGVLGADVAAGHASGPATVVGGRSTREKYKDPLHLSKFTNETFLLRFETNCVSSFGPLY